MPPAKRVCDNCGQPVLPSDVICWHCGWELQPQADAAQTEALNEPAVPEPFPLPATLAFGIFTIVVILGALLVMRSLGQKPVVALNSATSRAGWVVVDDNNLRFTLDLPQTWSWQSEAALRSRQPSAGAVPGVPLGTAVQPLGDIVDDLELLLLANSNDSQAPGFLVIARSERLGQLTPDEANRLLIDMQNEAWEIVDIGPGKNLAGHHQLRYAIHHTGADQQCESLFVPLGEAAYLIGACGPSNRVERYAQVFDNILDSFQPLE